MLTLNIPKSIAATVLILAISCAPLLAKARRAEPRKSKVSKTEVEQPPQAPSEATQSPKINVNKSSRGRIKSTIRRNFNVLPDKAVSRYQQSVKRTQRKSTTIVSNKPARVAAKTPSPCIQRNPGPPSLPTKSTNRPKPNIGNTITKAASSPQSQTKTISTGQNRSTNPSQNVIKAPFRYMSVKRTAGVVKAERNGRKIAGSRKQQKTVITRTHNRAGKSSTVTQATKPVFKADKPSRSSFGDARQTTVSSDNRISLPENLRIAKAIAKKEPTVSTAKKLARSSKLRLFTGRKANGNISKVSRESKTIDTGPKTLTETSRERKSLDIKVVDRISAGSRVEKVVPENRKIIRNRKVINRTGNKIVNNTKVADNTTINPGRVGRRGKSHKHHLRKGRSSKLICHERSHVVKHIHHYEHVYRDYRGWLCHRIVWPRYCFAVYYNWGPRFTFRYVYPYYHRKYVFVSLGGYWPAEYKYVRYYWYGCHPYRWYGYYPIAHEVKGDTYNYYTYNYYYADSTIPSASSTTTQGIGYVDHTTFADVRERLAQQTDGEPAPETLADRYFEEAVEAFEAGDYDIAAGTFGQAIELAPDDKVLAFAYAQALFANEQYSEASEALRLALAKVPPEKEGVFYPRGLYPEDDILFEQIDRLTEKAELYSFDADLQLLLGYQLLGIGEIDKAVEPLQRACQDLENAAAATTLLDLLEKIRTENAEHNG